MPAFADEESIALYAEIRDKQRLLSRQGTELGQKAERVVIMRQHLHQLKAEANHLENLVAAKEAHIHSDKHMEGVAVRQTSKLKSEVQQQQQQQQQLQSRLTALQVDVAKGQEQMDCFKLRMRWNEDELAQWRSAAHQKEVSARSSSSDSQEYSHYKMRHRFWECTIDSSGTDWAKIYS